MNIHFIKTPQKRKILDQLNETYGIEELPYLLVESGKEKIRALSTHLSKDEIAQLSLILNVQGLGIYILKEEIPSIRLSLDGTHLLSNQIKKNVLELNSEQANEWMQGNNIKTDKEKGIYVIKYDNYFLGCGKSNGETLFNHVPKDRRTNKKFNLGSSSKTVTT